MRGRENERRTDFIIYKTFIKRQVALLLISLVADANSSLQRNERILMAILHFELDRTNVETCRVLKD